MDEPDSGVVRNRGIKIGYLPQMPQLEEGLSAIDAVMASESLLARCLRTYDQAMTSGNKKACMHAASLLLPIVPHSPVNPRPIWGLVHITILAT